MTFFIALSLIWAVEMSGPTNKIQQEIENQMLQFKLSMSLGIQKLSVYALSSKFFL